MAKIPIEVTSETGDAQRDLNKLEQSLSGLEQAGQEAQTGLDGVGAAGDEAARGAGAAGDGAEQAGDSFKIAGLTLTDLKSGLDMAGQALAKVGQAYDATVGAVLAYSDQVRDLARISGASTEETSRLIQASDDLQVEYSTLEQAAKALAKDGIALTTEELAKASDEYLAIEDAGGRAEYATTKFGRAGLELTKVLETGGAALREMAAATDESMVLTEEQTKAARNLEVALDNMEDSVQGVKYAIGNAFIPAITEAIEKVMKFSGEIKKTLTVNEDISKVMQLHAADVLKTAGSYDEYRKEMERAAKAAGYTISATGEVQRAVVGANGAVTQMNVGVNILTDYYKDLADEGTRAAAASKLFARDTAAAGSAASATTPDLLDLALALQNEEGAYTDTGSAARKYTSAVEDSAIAMGALKDSMSIKSTMDGFKKQQDDLKQKIGATNLEIEKLTKLKTLNPEEILKLNQFWQALQLAEKAAKGLGTAGEGSKSGIEAMNAALQKVMPGLPVFTSAKDAVARLRDEVNKLSQGTYRTPEQQAQLDGLLGNLSDLEQAERDLATAQEEATKKMLFNMLLQQAASDGLTKIETDNLIKIAEKWGLVDAKSAATARALNAIDLSEAKGELGEFDAVLASIMGRPSSKTVTVTTRFIKIGDDVDEPGVPVPGPEGWGGGGIPGGGGLAGMQSDTPFSVNGIPRGQSTRSGTTNNYYSTTIIGWQGDGASLAAEIARRAEVARIMGG